MWYQADHYEILMSMLNYCHIEDNNIQYSAIQYYAGAINATFLKFSNVQFFTVSGGVESTLW